MDTAAIELVRGVYLKTYFEAHFPPMDLDAKSGRVSSYNLSFAVDMFRKKKQRGCHVDPEISDAVIKATMFFKFDSGSTGASLHSLMGKSSELVSWPDVLNAMRILRHICDGFVHPTLDVHLALLITRIEDLRVLYVVIPLTQWIQILHKRLALLRDVTGIIAMHPHKEFTIILGELFHIDPRSPDFVEAVMHSTCGFRSWNESVVSSPPQKRQRKSVPISSGGTQSIVNTTSVKTMNRTSNPKPVLQGTYPCHNWICNRAPCFTSTTCLATPKPGDKRGVVKARPHQFDNVDAGVEAEYIAWVKKMANP